VIIGRLIPVGGQYRKMLEEAESGPKALKEKKKAA